MMERLREGIWRLQKRLRREKRPQREENWGAVKGWNRSVIVMKPESELFSQVVFVLRDDYLCRSSSQQELLREAQRAAAACGCRCRPYGKGKRWIGYVCMVLVLLCGAWLLRFFGFF